VCNEVPIGITTQDGNTVTGAFRLPVVDPPERYKYAVSDATPCT
jgi:hypothetical protein